MRIRRGQSRTLQGPRRGKSLLLLTAGLFRFQKASQPCSWGEPLLDIDLPHRRPRSWRDVDRVYLGERKKAAAEILFDGHFEINRPIEENELKMKKRTRGRPEKVIASCTSEDKTRKLTKNRTGGIRMAARSNGGNVLGLMALLNGENAADKLELLPAIAKASPGVESIIHDNNFSPSHGTALATFRLSGRKSSTSSWADSAPETTCAAPKIGQMPPPQSKEACFGEYVESGKRIRVVPQLPPL